MNTCCGWSAGPWTDGSHTDNGLQLEGGVTTVYANDGAEGAPIVAYVPGDLWNPDATLIAYAAEMADAITAWATRHPQCARGTACSPECGALHSLAKCLDDIRGWERAA